MEKTNNGKFSKSLLRKGEEVLTARAEAVIDMASMSYRQRVEQLELEGRKLDREQLEILDFSPDDANSLKPAKDFNADDFVKRDMELAYKIEVHKVRLKATKARLADLFGAV